MQATRYLVGLAAKFGAGMKHGHHCFQCRYVGRRVDVHRDTPPVIRHGDAAVFMKGDHGPGAAASHSLIDAVVGDFIDKMVQAALVG